MLSIIMPLAAFSRHVKLMPVEAPQTLRYRFMVTGWDNRKTLASSHLALDTNMSALLP